MSARQQLVNEFGWLNASNPLCLPLQDRLKSSRPFLHKANSIIANLRILYAATGDNMMNIATRNADLLVREPLGLIKRIEIVRERGHDIPLLFSLMPRLFTNTAYSQVEGEAEAAMQRHATGRTRGPRQRGAEQASDQPFRFSLKKHQDLLRLAAAGRLDSPTFAINQAWIKRLNQLIQVDLQAAQSRNRQRYQQAAEARIKFMKELGWFNVKSEHAVPNIRQHFGTTDQKLPAIDNTMQLLELFHEHLGDQMMAPVRKYPKVLLTPIKKAREKIAALEAGRHDGVSDALLRHPSTFARQKTALVVEQQDFKTQDLFKNRLSLAKDAGWLAAALTLESTETVEQPKIRSLNALLESEGRYLRRGFFEAMGWVAPETPLPLHLEYLEGGRRSYTFENMRNFYDYLGSAIMTVVEEAPFLLRREPQRLKGELALLTLYGFDVPQLLKTKDFSKLLKIPGRLKEGPLPKPTITSTSFPPASKRSRAKAARGDSSKPEARVIPETKVVKTKAQPEVSTAAPHHFKEVEDAFAVAPLVRRAALQQLAMHLFAGELNTLIRKCPNLITCDQATYDAAVKAADDYYYNAEAPSSPLVFRVINRALQKP